VQGIAEARGGALDLAVRADNTRARHFYEKVGFVAIGSELGRRSDMALVWMRFVGT
jgi:ribosomal protein S18 acetylase RimI-like enzyme